MPLHGLYILGALLALPNPAGTWLPTPGPGGERPVLALTQGGDGAVYGVGAGVVYRVVPGGEWSTIGRYAPVLRWTGDDEIEVEGPFDRAYLLRVAEQAEAVVEAATGLELTNENLTEDLVAGILQAYVEEDEPSPDSPWFVGGIVPTPRGVWVGTGAGLFRVDAKGVRGPVGEIAPILQLIAAGDAVIAATERGVYRIAPDGQAQLWLPRAVRALGSYQGRPLLITDEGLLHESAAGQLARLDAPTGLARLAVGDGDRLWVATDLAVYRYAGGQWTLCDAIPSPPRRIVPGEDQVMVVTAEGLYLGDASCQQWSRVETPWPGGVSFHDAIRLQGSLWAGTSDGVFILGPPDELGDMVLRRAAFDRAIARLPAFDVLVDAAVKHQRMDAASTGYGLRPVLRGLLPDISLQIRKVDELRLKFDEDDETVTPGEVRVLGTEYSVQALWTVRFDILTLLYDVEAASVEAESAESAASVGELEAQVEAETGVVPDVEIEGAGEEAVVVTSDGEVVVAEVDTDVVVVDSGELETPEVDALARVSAERRLLRRERRSTVEQLKKLYRERLRLTHRLWLGTGEQDEVALVLRLHEIDAAIDALTGGAMSQRKRN